MHSASHESFRQRRKDNTNVVQASPMGNHLRTNMQGLVAKRLTTILKTFAIPGVPNTQHRDKIKSGYFTPAVMGTHMWTKRLHSACCLGTPQCGDSIKVGYMTTTILGAHMRIKWLHEPCCLGGSPTPGAGRKLEVAT